MRTRVAVAGHGALRSGGGFGLNGDGREVFRVQGIFGHGLPNPAALTLRSGREQAHSTTKAPEKRSRPPGPPGKAQRACSAQANRPRMRSAGAGSTRARPKFSAAWSGRGNADQGGRHARARTGRTAGPVWAEVCEGRKTLHDLLGQVAREPALEEGRRAERGQPQGPGGLEGGPPACPTCWERYATPCAIARLTGSCTARK